MSARLPDISLSSFALGLERISPEPLPSSVIGALHQHYLDLARWNKTLSLVGPGNGDDLLARHYGEALAALPLVPPEAAVAVDIGSGAGFPGLVLAAARPQIAMTLVEAQERKWSFLLTAARHASLPCQCLNARVAVPLPPGFPEDVDLVTVRALKLRAEVLEVLAGRLTDDGHILLWLGEQIPELPPILAVAGEVRLMGSDRRRIVALRRLRA